MSPNSLLAGLTVAAGQSTRCDVCGATLRPNDYVELLALEGDDLEPVVTRCSHCARGAVRAGTERECVLVVGSARGIDRRRWSLAAGAFGRRDHRPERIADHNPA
ncbi:hypothetical protein [Natronorubrum sulfidifaciens]|nr:hypothetical protein [Natronorubrum sulfidifaciens]